MKKRKKRTAIEDDSLDDVGGGVADKLDVSMCNHCKKRFPVENLEAKNGRCFCEKCTEKNKNHRRSGQG